MICLTEDDFIALYKSLVNVIWNMLIQHGTSTDKDRLKISTDFRWQQLNRLWLSHKNDIRWVPAGLRFCSTLTLYFAAGWNANGRMSCSELQECCKAASYRGLDDRRFITLLKTRPDFEPSRVGKPILPSRTGNYLWSRLKIYAHTSAYLLVTALIFHFLS